MPYPQSQREFALHVVRQLRDAGHEALWAGGCVRDELLGNMPKDYDVATSARPELVRELFGKRRTLAIGASFGVISVLGGKHLDPIEVATFRSDGAYVDGRHPTEVHFTTAEEDAQRRDFTINGLFYDPIGDKLIDYVGGERDLQLGVVRAIGEARARFGEDKLRMLRAVRFATTLGFSIDEYTLAAIQSMADEIQVVSAERIGVELRKILLDSHCGTGVELLKATGLLRSLLPTLADLAGDDPPAWEQLLRRLDTIPGDSLAVAFAGLLLDFANMQLVQELGRSFRFTNKEIERAAWLVDKLDVVRRAATLPWHKYQRILAHEGAEDLLALAIATYGIKHEGVSTCLDSLALPPEALNPAPLVTGDDLVAHGLKPGKHFGELLDYVRDAQLEQQIANRQEALQLVDQWLRDHPLE